MFYLRWPLFPKMLGVEPRFVDLSGLFSQVACVERQLDIGSSYKYAARSCAFVYTEASYFALSYVSDVKYLAVTLGLIQGALVVTVLVIFFARFLREFNAHNVLLSLSLLLSPPVMLLIERGNVDGTVFLGVVLAAQLYEKRLPVAVFVVALTSLIKFYTLPLAWILSFGTKAWWKMMSLCLLGFVSLALFREAWWMRGRAPYPTNAGFGNPMLGKYLQPGGSDQFIDLLVGLSVCVIALLAGHYLKKWKKSSLNFQFVSSADSSRIRVFIFLAIVHLTCYFLTANYDYRLIFVAIQLPLMLEILNLTRKWKYFYCMNTIVIFWFSFNVGILQPIGDLSIGIHTVSLLMILKENRSQIREVLKVAK